MATSQENENKNLLIKKQHPQKKVLILGAGLSGIIAGKTLMDNGVDDFLILEGQDYIGGRIKQHSFAGFEIEEGANWIQFADHDETQPIWERKEETDLKGTWTKYSYPDLIIRNETGLDLTDQVDNHTWDDVKHKYKLMKEEREKNQQVEISIREGLALFGWELNNSAHKAWEFFFSNYDFGIGPEQTSFSDFFIPENEFFVTDPRGMITLFKTTYEKFEEKIMLSKKVTDIKYDSKSVEVATSDGDVYTADYGLCTFSTGVLASDLVTFTPPLPEWKREAILKMPMSVYTKIFLKFPYKFWDDKEYILLASNKKGFFPVIQDLDKPGKFPGSGMLLVTVTDDEGRRIEKQSFEKTKEEIVTMLRGIYGQGVPEPTDIFYPRWFTNPFVQGAYTSTPLGTTSEDVEKLGKDLENLYFAGEGTAKDWAGYMQGAYWTGMEKGYRIASIVQQREIEN